jgi:hypothetical protein
MMKTTKIILGLMVVIIFGFLYSCQDDAENITVTDALNRQSELTRLLSSVSANGNTSMSVIDSTNCFRVTLPVDVLANGQQITVSDTTDYATVEAVFNQSDDNYDNLDFVFPITIIYIDGTQQQVTSQPQYDSLMRNCFNSSQLINNTCVSLNYPITIYGYNSSLQMENTYLITSNEQLYPILLNLRANEYYSIAYPVTLNISGQSLSVNNNTQLQLAINAAIANCNPVVPIDPDPPVTCNNPGVLTDSLKIYIPFSGSVRDLKGAMVTAPTDTIFVADRNGNARCALAFNGGQALRIRASASNAIKDGDELSISFWFKMQNTNPSNLEHLFAKGPNGTNGFNLSVYDLNKPLFSAQGGQVWDINWGIDAGLTTDTTNWHHLVLTLTANYEAKLYRDGVLQNNASFTDGSIGASIVDYYIGQGFTGQLDDLRVYKKVLTQVNVQTLYELEGDCNTCLN